MIEFKSKLEMILVNLKLKKERESFTVKVKSFFSHTLLLTYLKNETRYLFIVTAGYSQRK